MRRVLAGTVLGLILVATPAYAKGPKTHRIANVAVCPSDWWRGTEAHRIAETRELVECEARLFGVSVPTALRVCDCESDFRYWLVNRSGCAGYGCFGAFQLHGRYWPGWMNAYLGYGKGWRKKPLNARSNVVTALKKVNADGSWSAWSCF